MKKNSFCLPLENLVPILPKSGFNRNKNDWKDEQFDAFDC
jgi:hypothetical protein